MKREEGEGRGGRGGCPHSSRWYLGSIGQFQQQVIFHLQLMVKHALYRHILHFGHLVRSKVLQVSEVGRSRDGRPGRVKQGQYQKG